MSDDNESADFESPEYDSESEIEVYQHKNITCQSVKRKRSPYFGKASIRNIAVEQKDDLITNDNEFEGRKDVDIESNNNFQCKKYTHVGKTSNSNSGSRRSLYHDEPEDVEEYRRRHWSYLNFMNDCLRSNYQVGHSQGRGIPLKEIPWLLESINSKRVTPKKLKEIHRFLFEDVGNPLQRKKDILTFKGFSFQDNSGTCRKKRMELDKYPVTKMKQVFRLLNLNVDGKKHEIAERIMEFFMRPTADLKFKQGKHQRGIFSTSNNRLLRQINTSLIEPRRKRCAATRALKRMASSLSDDVSSDESTSSESNNESSTEDDF